MTSIKKTTEERSQTITKILDEYPDLAQAIDPMFNSIQAILTVVLHTDHSTDRLLLFMLWRQIVDYQEDSLILILDKRFDAGIALLRMTTELARDIARMNEDVTNIKMWQNKLKINRETYYKHTFRFNKKDHLEKLVYKQYNAFSELGTHGHTGTISHQTPIGTTPDGKFMKLEIPDEAVIRNVALWMMAFFPVNKLCARVFEEAIIGQERQLLSAFDQLATMIGDLAISWQDYGKNHSAK
jgi:hypothetical protein